MDQEILKKYSNVDECPVRNVLDRIGNKWTLLVLLVLEEQQVLRFNELHTYISTISQKMLSVTLKSLEADGLVKRTIYPQVPPKVEYELTARAQSLLPLIHNLVDWSKTHINAIKTSRKHYELVTRK
ncbi:winged helix-turn-helix transcriptional regulator [Aestuariibaculum suncheonense]|uniref:Helix-turn-helix transcriptional regulator n=1 Tax=Aestuariibaculum suncheonense TaxID=1028745 RepID=A0A8J6UB97_9FLAO|nr:helix-turn-helix domain-containing protein [Aestuariibaculum suncheonense]MBD0835262.1 helix-turn-helix transcriptional regulator [Aestuariibaculum suncheonense]